MTGFDRHPPASAYIVAVGSELLTPSRQDTNSLFLTARLNEIGIEVCGKAVVGDERETLAATLRHALEHADLVILTGGLGPTEDDVTREVVAGELGLALEEDGAAVERLRARFTARRMTMPEINRRQALVPRGATVLPNPNGTAPGLWLEAGERLVILLPGPPLELQPIFEAVVAERLRPRTRGLRVWRRELRVTGRTESQVDELAQPLYSRWTSGACPIATTILATFGQIELHLSVRAATSDEAAASLGPAVSALVEVLAPAVYSVDGRSLEQVVGDLLRERRASIAVAESCTGGLVTSRLTDVPGSSDYVERGVVTYSNRAKTDLLGVPEALIAEHGAVSEAVAVAMAAGIRQRACVEVGVGVTGIAGPTGGTADKPVGTVAIAVSRSAGHRSRRFLFVGRREQVKFQASQAALDMVRRWLLEDVSPVA
jgi:nicotinamide-nucleotide amidase